MTSRLAAPMLAVVLAACGGSSTAATAPTPAAPSVTGGAFTLTSTVGIDGGTLPADYTCDGTGSTIPLSWSNPPAGTREFALMMTTLPGDGTTKWNWVLYGIPGTTTGLARNSSGVGTPGVGSDGPASQKGKTGLSAPGALTQ